MPYEVKAAVRALRVFEIYAAEGRALSLAELAGRAGIPPSSCLLLIRTLLQRGYLYEVGPRTVYYPTRRLMEHAIRISQHDPIVERLASTLSALRDATRETVGLSKLHGSHTIYLAVFDSPEIVRPAITSGTLRPLHSTAAGKALLSCLDAETRSALLDQTRLERFTPRTVKSRAQLEADISRMRARGWFSNEGETVPDMTSIAVPLRLQSGNYAITVFGPAYRMNRRRDEHVSALRKVALELRRGDAAAPPPGRPRAATRAAARNGRGAPASRAARDRAPRSQPGSSDREQP